MKKRPSPLNKYQLSGRLWLAADIHLGPHAPKTAAAFYAFLEQARQHTDSLFLCGDIFEAWIGDDVIYRPEPWLQTAIDALQRCSQQVDIYIQRGNRDFLLGQRFAQHIGAELLPDEVLICTPHCHFVLAHGDQFCTQDRAYLRYRAVVHHPWVQALFLRLPLSWREQIAAKLRAQSKSRPYTQISDIHEPTIAALMAEQQVRLLLHGHTHRPAIHPVPSLSGPSTHPTQSTQPTQPSASTQPTQPKAPTQPIKTAACIQAAVENTDMGLRVVIPDWEYDHSEPVRGGWVSIDSNGQLSLHQQGHRPVTAYFSPASGGNTVF